MVAKVSGHIEEDQLQEALESTVKSQVMLRSRVELHKKNLQFIVEENLVPQLKVLKRKGESHWKDAVEEELKDEVSVESFPLWRFTWLKGEEEHEFLMTFNHLLSDGRSGVNFFKILLRKLDQPETALNENSLFPSYEKQLKKTHGLVKSFKQKYSAFRNYQQAKKHEWFQLRACHEKEGATAVESRVIDSDDLNRLLKSCKENEVTISTYLSAVMSEVFSENTKKSNSLSLAVDMRPYLKNELSEDIGYFVTSVDLIKDKDYSGDKWTLAQKYKKRLHSQLNHSQFKFDVLMRSLAIKAGKDNIKFRDLIRDVLNNSMLLTNIGKINIRSEYKNFKLKHCFHVPSVHLMGLPFI